MLSAAAGVARGRRHERGPSTSPGRPAKSLAAALVVVLVAAHVTSTAAELVEMEGDSDFDGNTLPEEETESMEENVLTPSSLSRDLSESNNDLLHLVKLLNAKRNSAFRLKRNNSFRLKRNNSFRLKRSDAFRLKRSNAFRLKKRSNAFRLKKQDEEVAPVSTRNTSFRLRRNNSFRLKKRMLPGFYFNLFRHPIEDGSQPGQMRSGGRHLIERRSDAFRL